MLQAIGLWLAILIFRVAMAGWRIDRLPWWQRLFVPIGWMLPSLFVAGSTIWRDVPLPHLPLVLMAWTRRLRRVFRALRRALVSSRLAGDAHGGAVSRAAAAGAAALSVARRFRRQREAGGWSRRNTPLRRAAIPRNCSRTSTRRCARSIAFPACPISSNRSSGSAPSTEAAFSLWSATDLEQFRLTSAVELYGSDGALVSRFALNLPDTEAADNYKSKRCDWEIFGQAIPVGADLFRMLHAERGICGRPSPAPTTQRIVGAVVLHVMLDYSALRFISSQSPYFEFIRGLRPETRLGTTGGDVELAVYGWGHLPIFTSGNRAWQLGDDIFAQATDTRDPFWTVIPRGDARDHAYVSNDRAGHGRRSAIRC